MKTLTRHPTNKYKSAKQFKKNTRRTKGANVQTNPQRGGYRF